jgi:hypothetical protein
MEHVNKQAEIFQKLSIQNSFKKALAQVNPTTVVVENPNNIPEQAKEFVYNLTKQVNNAANQLKNSNPGAAEYLNNAINYIESLLASKGNPGPSIKAQTEKLLNNLNYLQKSSKDGESSQSLKYLADEVNQAINLMNSVNFEKFYTNPEDIKPVSAEEPKKSVELPKKSITDVAKQLMSKVKGMTKENVNFQLAKFYQQYFLPVVDQYKKLMDQKTPERPVLDPKSEAKIEQLKSIINTVKSTVGSDNFAFLTISDPVLSTFAGKKDNQINKLYKKFANDITSEPRHKLDRKFKEIFSELSKMYMSGLKSPAMGPLSTNLGEAQDVISEAKTLDQFKASLSIVKNKLEALKFFTDQGNAGTGRDNLLSPTIGKNINDLLSLVNYYLTQDVETWS